jgi:hypothetical protein
MSFFRADIDISRLKAKGDRVPAVFAATLDRFVKRGAMVLEREEKEQAPKAFTTLTNSITVQKNAQADYSVTPMARYAAAVNNGGRPHKAPLLPLYLWLKYTKRVSDERELRKRTYGLQRFIAKHGTKANPFVNRSVIKQQGNVVRFIRQGIEQGIQEAYGQ